MNWIVANRISMEAFVPEILLLGTSLLILMMGAFCSGARKSVAWISLISLFAYVCLSFRLLTNESNPQMLFSGAISLDSFAIFFKIFFGFVSAFTLVFLLRSSEMKDYSLAEVSSFLLTLTVGMSMMAASMDLLMMFLSLEMVSVLSYILVGYKRKDRVSSEAGLKYILYGAVASGIMVFGLSYLFGLVGSTDLVHLKTYFQNLEGISEAPVVLFALLCTMMGLGYKIATFPSQMWCPDVYQGAPLPVTTFLSVGPKAAGFAMLLRFFYTAFQVHDGKGVEIFEFIKWNTVVTVLAAVTMTIGNLAAIPQRNLKRLMAYSSIAHAGYLLMGFAALSTAGAQAILFYLMTYFLMNFGVFFIILIVSNQLGSEEIDAYRGLGWRSPVMGTALVIFLASLTGLPPFAGFIGKFYIFSAVIDEGLYVLAVIGVINTVISLFYYFRIVKIMYFETPLDESPLPVIGLYRTVILCLAIPTVIVGVYWKPLWDFAAQSVISLL